MGHRTNQQWKTAVKLHIDQMMRTRNFRVRNDAVERGSVTKSQKGNKGSVERKVGECFQWDEKDDRLLLHSIQWQNRLTEKKATKKKILTREVRFCVDI